jgi:hypothetical protein
MRIGMLILVGVLAHAVPATAGDVITPLVRYAANQTVQCDVLNVTSKPMTINVEARIVGGSAGGSECDVVAPGDVCSTNAASPGGGKNLAYCQVSGTTIKKIRATLRNLDTGERVDAR